MKLEMPQIKLPRWIREDSLIKAPKSLPLTFGTIGLLVVLIEGSAPEWIRVLSFTLFNFMVAFQVIIALIAVGVLLVFIYAQGKLKAGEQMNVKVNNSEIVRRPRTFSLLFSVITVILAFMAQLYLQGTLLIVVTIAVHVVIVSFRGIFADMMKAKLKADLP